MKNSDLSIGFHGSSSKATGSPHSGGYLGVLATQPGASCEPSDKSLFLSGLLVTYAARAVCAAALVLMAWA
ncbi:MAG: hypothetical protein ACI8QC_004441, partial [Planctomycetota bacterium]